MRSVRSARSSRSSSTREHRILGRAGNLERDVDLTQRQRVGGPLVHLQDVQSERRLDRVRDLSERGVRGRLGESGVEGAHRTLAHEASLHAGDGVRGLRHRHLGEVLASPHAVRDGGGPFAGGERIRDGGPERDAVHVHAGAGGPDELVHAFVVDLPDFILRNGDLGVGHGLRRVDPHETDAGLLVRVPIEPPRFFLGYVNAALDKRLQLRARKDGAVVALDLQQLRLIGRRVREELAVLVDVELPVSLEAGVAQHLLRWLREERLPKPPHRSR